MGLLAHPQQLLVVLGQGCGVLWGPQWALLALPGTTVPGEGRGCPLLKCPPRRNPLALPFVGLYGLLILLLMAIDLCHFYRTRRCHLRRLLPCACRVVRRALRGHRASARPSSGAPRLTRPSRGC